MKGKSNIPKGYITVAEAAKEFNLNRATLYSWIHGGHITAVKLGPRRVFVSREDVKRQVTPTVVAA